MEPSRQTPPVSKEYWNEHARTFPRFEEGEDNYEAGVMREIRAHGVDFRGATVLDVGCGSGMYTIRIAREARRVTALDVSDVMLDILRADAEALKLDNIDYVRSEWMDFERDETFDIVFCSMTPAIQSEASRRKLLRHAHGKTVFMGFAGRMRSNVMAGLYAHHGVTPRVFANGTDMCDWLDEQGIPYEAHPVEGTWVVSNPLEKLADSCATFLSQYGVTAERRHLLSYLAAFEEEPGRFVERTDYKIDLLIWDKPSA
ncbi:Methyltransferase type 11 [Pseudodesulfovibrio mercurii]|uniref:Methyltransferase type 11 n=1 Tax=Pseudodesulfovibrio mercurii TaxID=641491 RepID=F0JF04_9BACT|nr:class I SAM-dependent methyltransferase [Pseudodesulfovibrio mercurii]EGB14805.1 Methyltransferase type 11 [Pseudodesulfovibrio mercurii]